MWEDVEGTWGRFSPSFLARSLQFVWGICHFRIHQVTHTHITVTAELMVEATERATAGTLMGTDKLIIVVVEAVP
jgi:hypothetical protein